MSPLFPLFLKMEGERAVVVGGGPIGARKAAELRACGAAVRAVSPRFHDAWAGLDVERLLREFQAGDSRGARLVFAATGEASVDEAVVADARREGALVNVVDVPERCDFYGAGVVRRGPLTIAVGTSGASPALARHVRARLEETVPIELGALAEALGALRPALLARYPDFAERSRRLDAAVREAMAALPAHATPDLAAAALRARLELP